MERINVARMTAGYNMRLESSGRELLVVVIKGTFVLPKPGEPHGCIERKSVKKLLCRSRTVTSCAR